MSELLKELHEKCNNVKSINQIKINNGKVDDILIEYLDSLKTCILQLQECLTTIDKCIKQSGIVYYKVVPMFLYIH
jgi:hypothetical protein